jgi:hypothetical protein
MSPIPQLLDLRLDMAERLIPDVFRPQSLALHDRPDCTAPSPGRFHW